MVDEAWVKGWGGVIVLTKALPQPSGEDICIHCIRTNQCLRWRPCCQADLNLDTHLLDDCVNGTYVILLSCYWAVNYICGGSRWPQTDSLG